MEPPHITEIKQEFQEKTARVPGITPEQEKQILHEIITERIGKPGLGTSTQQDDDNKNQQTDTKQSAIKPTSPLKQGEIYGTEHQAIVHTLVQMAVNEDLYKATQLAYDTKNPYLIDQFHDTLVDQFYDRIKANN